LQFLLASKAVNSLYINVLSQSHLLRAQLLFRFTYTSEALIIVFYIGLFII